jgi:hypothetical protein
VRQLTNTLTVREFSKWIVRFYRGFDVTSVANEVNKFGQIFPTFRGVGNTRIWDYFHPFDFTPKSHLLRIILCQGTPYFFPNLFQNHFVYHLFVSSCYQYTVAVNKI